MSSKALHHDRLRAALQPRSAHRRRGRVRGRVGRDRRTEAAERGADRGAQPRARSWARRRRSRGLDEPGDAVILDVRPLDAYLAAHAHGAINVPIDGSSFATKAGFMLLPEEAVVIRAATEDEAHARRPQPARDRASSRSPATCCDGRRRADRAGDARRARAAGGRRRRRGARRARAGRARGRVHPGQPQRPVPARPPLRRRAVDREAHRHRLRERPRAAVAASALAHEGLDARPVLGGGVAEWEERHRTVAFRRCGDS